MVPNRKLTKNKASCVVLQARVHVHLLCDCFITYVYTFMITLHFCFIVNVVRKGQERNLAVEKQVEL